MRTRLCVLSILVMVAGCSPDDTVTVSGEAAVPSTTLEGSGDSLAYNDGEFYVPDPGIVDFPPVEAAELGDGWEHVTSNVEDLDPTEFSISDDCQIETPPAVEGEVHFFRRGQGQNFLQLVFEAEAEALSEWIAAYRELAECGEVSNDLATLEAKEIDVVAPEGSDESLGLLMLTSDVEVPGVQRATLVFALYGDTLLVGVAPELGEPIEADWVADVLAASATAGGLN